MWCVSSLFMNWRLKVWDVVWWETNKNKSFLLTQTFQKLKKIKATKLFTLFQNRHSFLVSKNTKIDACCLRFSFDGTVSQSCLVEVNYLLLVNECTWVLLHVVVVLSELYGLNPKVWLNWLSKFRERKRIKSMLCFQSLVEMCIAFILLLLKTSFWNFLIFWKIADCGLQFPLIYFYFLSLLLKLKYTYKHEEFWFYRLSIELFFD